MESLVALCVEGALVLQPKAADGVCCDGVSTTTLMYDIHRPRDVLLDKEIILVIA